MQRPNITISTTGTSLDGPNALAFDSSGDLWVANFANSTVVEFTPGQTGVKVRVTFDSESTYSIEQQRQGWQSILNNFARHVEANRNS